MVTHRVHLFIHTQRYGALDGSKMKFVSAVSESGLRSEFSDPILNRFVTHGGVHGAFKFKIDSLNNLKSVSGIS
ncbi:MAG: hypothetical protein ACI945_000250 [Pseudohongiellaceae bacterium]|jgi:hypothetical protein